MRVTSTYYNWTCMPSSTTRLSGISKYAVAWRAFRDILEKSCCLHRAITPSLLLTKVSRERKKVVFIISKVRSCFEQSFDTVGTSGDSVKP